jgi:hypothetical protein
MQSNGRSLRDLYRTLETPGANRLRDAHSALDTAVRAAYGMKEEEEPLAFLLRLNLQLADCETKGQPITPPGLSPCIMNPEDFATPDCIQPASGRPPITKTLNQQDWAIETMNPNDLIAQQQAILQNAQNWQFIYLAILLGLWIVGGWVLYMFYARLRDIADELRKFRIAYEFAQERRPSNPSSENPFRP